MGQFTSKKSGELLGKTKHSHVKGELISKPPTPSPAPIRGAIPPPSSPSALRPQGWQKNGYGLPDLAPQHPVSLSQGDPGRVGESLTHNKQ
jgi:hypothetical protein